MDALGYMVREWGADLSRPSPIVLRYGRNQMLEMLRALDVREGVEVGTDRGLYAQKLCHANPQLHLTCVDPWQAYGYYHPHEYHEVSQEAVDACYAEATQRLAPYRCTILRKTSMEGVTCFPRESLDFVFIDGNHAYEYIRDDIAEWSTRVRRGGIVYGHDYVNDVQRAVNEYMARENITPWFVLHRGGKMIQCWMYVKS